MDNITPGPRPDPGIRIAVALEAPCPACVKADVCSLRPLVEQLQSVQVATPKMDPLLGLQLAGTVTCGAFVKDRIRKVDVGELEGKPKRTISPEGRAAMAAAAQARRARERAEREGTAA